MSARPKDSHAATASEPALRLRDGRVDDAEDIEAVHWAAREAVYRGRVSDWPPAGPDRLGRVERWRSWLASPEIQCIVAEERDRILGFGTIRPSLDDDAGDAVAEMPTLYVHPSAWRRGVGRAVCAACARRAADLGFDELTLWVLEMNRDARAFYSDFGFREDGARKIDEGTRERLPAHRYRLPLGDAA